VLGRKCELPARTPLIDDPLATGGPHGDEPGTEHGQSGTAAPNTASSRKWLPVATITSKTNIG